MFGTVLSCWHLLTQWILTTMPASTTEDPEAEKAKKLVWATELTQDGAGIWTQAGWATVRVLQVRQPKFWEMRGSAQVDPAGLSPTRADLLLVVVYVPGTCVRSFQTRIFSLQWSGLHASQRQAPCHWDLLQEEEGKMFISSRITDACPRGRRSDLFSFLALFRMHRQMDIALDFGAQKAFGYLKSFSYGGKLNTYTEG